MPKLIDVSAAFNNCAFHAIAAHLLAHQERTNALGVFDKLFNRPKGESELVDLFADNQAFENFFIQLRLQKAKAHPGEAEAGEMFEKVLILGVALRNHLKQLLLTDEGVKQRSQERFVDVVQNSKESAKDIGMDILLPSLLDGENGAMVDISKQIFNQPNFNDLTEEQVVAFWKKGCARAYANHVGSLDVLVSYQDIKPLCYALGIPFQMFHFIKTKPLSQGGEVASLTIDGAEGRQLFEPLTLLLNHEHYHIQLEDDNAFAAVFEKDNAFYCQAREECMALPIETTYKSSIAQLVRPLLFLASVLSKEDQSIPAIDSFLNAITGSLASKMGHSKASSVKLPFESVTIRKPAVASVQGAAGNDLVDGLIKAVSLFMGQPMPMPNALNALMRVCKESEYIKQAEPRDPAANLVLEQRLKNLPYYESSGAFVELIAKINKLQPQDRMPLKCALYALFNNDAPKKKAMVCTNLMAIAEVMTGAQDVPLQQTGLALFACCAIASVIIAATMGLIGVAVGVAAIGVAFCAMLYYTGSAKGSSAAMIDFVNDFTQKELSTRPSA